MDIRSYAFLFFIWLLSYLFFRSVLNRRPQNGCKTANLPPSPMALPLLGHLYLLGPLVHQSLDALAKRYGPIIFLHLASMGDIVVVSSPASAKEFLKSHDLTFSSRPCIFAQKYIDEDSVSFTFLPYGAQWKFLKKIMMTELFSPRKIEKMARIRQEEIKQLLGSLLEKSRAGERVDLEDMLEILTNNIICRMTMGMKSMGVNSEANEYRKVIHDHIELSSKLNTVHFLMGSLANLDLFGYGKKLQKANKRFLAMLDKIMEEYERRQQLKKENKTKEVEDGEEEEEDFVGVLLKISEDKAAEFKLTRRKIRTCLLVSFFSLQSKQKTLY